MKFFIPHAASEQTESICGDIRKSVEKATGLSVVLARCVARKERS